MDDTAVTSTGSLEDDSGQRKMENKKILSLLQKRFLREGVYLLPAVG